MDTPPRYRLSDAEKDVLLVEQAALIERLAARVAELEALVGKPKKTSANSHTRPSQDGPGRKARKPVAKPLEPRRDCRRLFGLSQAAIAEVSVMAWNRASASAGGMLPMGPRIRR